MQHSFKDANATQAPTTVSTARLVLLVPPSPPIILHSGGLIKVRLTIMIINIKIKIIITETPRTG